MLTTHFFGGDLFYVVNTYLRSGQFLYVGTGWYLLSLCTPQKVYHPHTTLSDAKPDWKAVIREVAHGH
jgi:hypothetical protein